MYSLQHRRGIGAYVQAMQTTTNSEKRTNTYNKASS